LNTPALVLCLSCVPEKVGINLKGINKKWYCHQKQGISVIEHSQPKGITLKMIEHKLESGVNWREVLKQKAYNKWAQNRD